jgi:hypothetical protein
VLAPLRFGKAMAMHPAEFVSLGTVREELEVRVRTVLARIDALADQSARQILLEFAREIDGCRSIAEVRELFVDQDEAATDYDEDIGRVLRRCDETFRPGVHANELVNRIEHELKQSTADLLRVLSYHSRRLP